MRKSFQNKGKGASIYHHISEGTFPKPVPLDPRAVGWLEHEIDSWLRQRVEARDDHMSNGR